MAKRSASTLSVFTAVWTTSACFLVKARGLVDEAISATCTYVMELVIGLPEFLGVVLNSRIFSFQLPGLLIQFAIFLFYLLHLDEGFLLL